MTERGKGPGHDLLLESDGEVSAGLARGRFVHQSQRRADGAHLLPREGLHLLHVRLEHLHTGRRDGERERRGKGGTGGDSLNVDTSFEGPELHVKLLHLKLNDEIIDELLNQ